MAARKSKFDATKAELESTFNATCEFIGIAHPPYRALHQGAAALLGRPRLVVFMGDGGEGELDEDHIIRVAADDRHSGSRIGQIRQFGIGQVVLEEGFAVRPVKSEFRVGEHPEKFRCRLSTDDGQTQARR